jgi:hypothetical protein
MENTSAMIYGIRRRLGKTDAGDHWGADDGPKPEIGDNPEQPEDSAALAANQASGQYAPDDPSAPDYYKILVQTAIENGGRHGYQSISIPWLRMILAGLESKQIEPDTMWYGIEAGEARGEPITEIPPYEDFFQSSRDA